MFISLFRDSDFNVPAYVGDPWSPNVTLSPSSSSSPHDEEAEDSSRIELAPSASSSSSAFSLTPSSPLASANNNPATNLNLLSTPRPKNNSQRGFRHRLVEGSPLLVVGGGGRGSNPASGNASFSSTAGVAGSVPGSPALDRSVGAAAASPGGGGSSSGPTPIGSPLVVQALLGPLSPAEARYWIRENNSHVLYCYFNRNFVGMFQYTSGKLVFLVEILKLETYLLIPQVCPRRVAHFRPSVPPPV